MNYIKIYCDYFQQNILYVLLVIKIRIAYFQSPIKPCSVHNFTYSNCSKIASTFLCSILNLLIRAGVHQILVRIANREDLDQTDSSVWSASALFSR